MPTQPRRLGKALVGAGFAADVSMMVFNVDAPDTADALYQLGVMPRCRVRKATFIMESAATAVTTFVASLQNKTGTVAVTGDLDIKTLAAATAATMVLSTVAGALDFAAEDVLELVLNEEGGTVTAPDLIGIVLEVQLLD